MTKDSKWHIEYGERVLGGRSFIKRAKKMRDLAPWYWGKAGLSHAFIRVVDPENRVKHQIHGAALELSSGQLAPSDIDAQGAKRAMWAANFTPANRLVSIDNPPTRLVAMVGDGDGPVVLNYLSKPAANLQTVFSGSQEDVDQRLKAALGKLLIFNELQAPFAPFSILTPAQSSNTIARLTLDAMGITDTIKSPFIRAGYGRRLLKSLPDLDVSRRSVADLSAAVMARVTPYVPESDGRFRRKEEVGTDRPVHFRDLSP